MTKDSIGIEELAQMVNGRLIGTTTQKLNGTCSINKYISGKITFIKNVRYGKMLEDLNNAVVLVPEGLREFAEKAPNNCYIIVDNVFESMMDLQDFFYNKAYEVKERSISPSAFIHPTASIGEKVYIGDHVHIGAYTSIGSGTRIYDSVFIEENVSIGKDCVLDPQVTIYHNCAIGNNCHFLSGTRIGIEGFRYEQNFDKKTVRKWIHMGKVIIGNNVDVAANSTIQRATYEDDATIIGDDVKIDSHAHIGHNCRVGERTIIAAFTCICGSTTIGKECWLGAGAKIAMGLKIHDRAKVLLNAIVVKDIPPGEVHSGFYAMPHREWKQLNQKWRESLETE